MPKHVLIVENNELLVRMYRSLLNAFDSRVTHAVTVRQIVRLIQGLRVDLVILDDRFSDGTGVHATRALRSLVHTREVPIIATVSQPLDNGVAAMDGTGYAAVVSKPFQLQALTALLGRFLTKV